MPKFAWSAGRDIIDQEKGNSRERCVRGGGDDEVRLGCGECVKDARTPERKAEAYEEEWFEYKRHGKMRERQHCLVVHKPKKTLKTNMKSLVSLLETS